MLYVADSSKCKNFELASKHEWMLANGIGGFAMGTVSGANTRRYHGHLVIADPAPANRVVLLGNIEAYIHGMGTPIGISCNQYQGTVHPEGHLFMEGFESGRFVSWRWKAEGMEIEKRLAIHPGVNATTIVYKNVGKKPLGLDLRPLVQHKNYHENFTQREGYPQVQAYPKDHTIVEHGGLSLILEHVGAQRLPEVGWYFRFEFQRELDRGLEARDDMYCPCKLHYELLPGEEAVLVASTEIGVKPFTDWQQSKTTTSLRAILQDATDKFLVETPGRTSIIAGYPWFTDWGRDTMISLPGICLYSGKIETAKKIVRDYLSQMHQGLIPNRFVEEGEKPEYNTVDATLWCANAIYRILEKDWDETFATTCYAALADMVEWHQKGTLYGIKMDSDGLLTQGAEGVQLTWMDAKVGDWVVTPRYGKPVEINGLWVNSLRILDWMGGKLGKKKNPYAALADKATKSFEEKFWKESIGHYMDTVEPDDASLRPNQVLAMSVPFSPCDPERCRRALQKVSLELLTPVGLRTLAASDSNYRGKFKGPIRELDAAYHQGTVWPWLMGPYVTALVRYTDDKAEARRLLKHGKELLTEYGVGGIAEVYDGDEPREPGGCPWQAWSLAEWLRAWVEDVEGK